MMRYAFALASGLLAAFLIPAAQAQRTPVFQSGTMVPGDATKFVTNGLIGDAGGTNGDALGAGINPFAISDRGDKGVALVDSPTTGAHHAFRLGHDSNGNAVLQIEAMNGADEAGLNCDINGVVDSCFGVSPLSTLIIDPVSVLGNLSSVAANPTAVPISDLMRVPDNATLAATATALYPKGVWRDDYAAGNGAPPLFFRPQEGSCASASLVNDGGSCVDAPSSNSWVAAPATKAIDPRQFGAKGTGTDDDAIPAQAAMDWAVKSNHPLYFPAGVWVFMARLNATLDTNGQSLTIYGDGPDNTKLVWGNGASSSGIKVTRNAEVSNVHFRDISILTEGINTGVGIDVDGGTVHNNNTASSTFDRVKVSGRLIGTSYWAKGIRLYGISAVNFNSIDVWGDSTPTTDGSEYQAVGLDISAPGDCSVNCGYIYNIVNSNFFGAKYGILYGSHTQGYAITNTNLTLNYVGVYVPPGAADLSELNIINSQLNNYSDNIVVADTASIPNVQLTNNLFFLKPDTAGFRSIGQVAYGQFIGNQCASTTGALMSGRCIYLEHTTAGNLISDTLCALITQCVFLDTAVSGVVVRGTVIDGGGADVLAVTSNSVNTSNHITGLNSTFLIANAYPQGYGIDAAADNGSGLIRLTVAHTALEPSADPTARLTNGQIMFVSAPGLSNMPGLYKILVIDATHVDLVASAYAGAYTTGGVFFTVP